MPVSNITVWDRAFEQGTTGWWIAIGVRIWPISPRSRAGRQMTLNRVRARPSPKGTLIPIAVADDAAPAQGRRSA